MSQLSADEKRELHKLQGKLQHLRDAVRGVCKSWHTGLFIYGEGGTSKSYTVIEELQKLRSKYVYHNTRLTARAFVDALERSPEELHLIEDAETLLEQKQSWGVLRSALWSQSKERPMKRQITWGTAQGIKDFQFTGGIIVISNVNLADTIPEVRAIKSRINVIGMDLNNEEIKALMKKICLDGFRYGSSYLDPQECLEVRAFVVNKLTELKRKLDLRLMVNGFRDYLQWKTGDSKLDWQELLQGRMSEHVVAYVDRKTKAVQKKQQALEIYKMPISNAEKIKMALEKYGMSQATYYRWCGKK